MTAARSQTAVRWLMALALGLTGLLGLPGPRVTRAANPVGASAAQPDPCRNYLGDSTFEAFISPWADVTQPLTVTLAPPVSPFDPNIIPLQTIATCDALACDVKPGVNDPAGPFSGSNWAWFGGGITSTTAISTVMQSVSQPLQVPAHTPVTLMFRLWISRADPGATANDRLQALVGNTPVFTATAAYTAPYASGYAPVRVDVSPWASGVNTTLTLSATTRALSVTAGSPLLPPVVNFNVDDISVCTYPVWLPVIAH